MVRTTDRTLETVSRWEDVVSSHIWVGALLMGGRIWHISKFNCDRNSMSLYGSVTFEQ